MISQQSNLSFLDGYTVFHNYDSVFHEGKEKGKKNRSWVSIQLGSNSETGKSGISSIVINHFHESGKCPTQCQEDIDKLVKAYFAALDEEPEKQVDVKHEASLKKMEPEESTNEGSFRYRVSNFFHKKQTEKTNGNENGKNWFQRKVTKFKGKMDEIEEDPKGYFKDLGRDLEDKFFGKLDEFGDWSSEKWDQFTCKFDENWEKVPYNKTVGYLLIKTGKVALFVLDAYVEANENK